MELLYKETLSNEYLKEFLDFKSNQYERPEFIQNDPIQIPKRFSNKEDIEIISFLICTIAWGSRKGIINSGHRLIEIMGDSPYDFIINYKKYHKKNQFVHRTFNSVDLDFFFRSLNHIYSEYNSLELCFSIDDSRKKNLLMRIHKFRTIFLESSHELRSEKHVANPMSGSACKRIVMFLRWMVRSSKKGVDFGIWNSINTNELMVPLDVHTSKVARKLKILNRKQNDWKSNEILYDNLIKFDPIDPAKYDFALFGLGAFEKF